MVSFFENILEPVLQQAYTLIYNATQNRKGKASWFTAFTNKITANLVTLRDFVGYLSISSIIKRIITDNVLYLAKKILFLANSI